MEIGWQEQCWEVPGVPVVPERFREKSLPKLPPLPVTPQHAKRKGEVTGKGGRKSLFFCENVGVWMPKRR